MSNFYAAQECPSRELFIVKEQIKKEEEVSEALQFMSLLWISNY